MGVWIIIIFLLLVFLSVPIAYSMLLVGFIYVGLTGNVSMSFVPQALVVGSAKYTILAIPFSQRISISIGAS